MNESEKEQVRKTKQAICFYTKQSLVFQAATDIEIWPPGHISARLVVLLCIKYQLTEHVHIAFPINRVDWSAVKIFGQFLPVECMSQFFFVIAYQAILAKL